MKKKKQTLLFAYNLSNTFGFDISFFTYILFICIYINCIFIIINLASSLKRRF